MKFISIIVFEILIFKHANCENVTAEQHLLPQIKPVPETDSNLLDLVPHVAEGIPVSNKNENAVNTVRFIKYNILAEILVSFVSAWFNSHLNSHFSLSRKVGILQKNPTSTQ